MAIRYVKNHDIDPEDIFLDSSNLPSFDDSQFQGRFEHPISLRAIKIAGAIFLLVGIIIAVRLWGLQIRQGEAFRIASENNHLRHVPIFAERGVIKDRNGVELAWNVPGEDNAFARRAYIEKEGFSHLIGYVGYPSRDESGVFYREDYVGKAGVEKDLGNLLAGENGTIILETDALAQVLSQSTMYAPKAGAGVALSIDANVQEVFFRTIKDTAHEVGFTGGAGLIMDVASGEIIAIVSYPEYNSDVFTNKNTTENISAYLTDPTMPMLFRATNGLFTPGSIVKPFIALSALAEEVISPDRKLYSSGKLVIANPYDPDHPSIFPDWKAHGYVNMKDALAISSNVYFYIIGGGFGDVKGLGINRMKKYLREFGFGATTGFELEPEASGVIPDPDWKEEHFDGDIWRIGDTYHTAIGQYGMQVTPLQVVRAIAMIANKGMLIAPTIEKRIDPIIIRTIALKEEDFQIVQDGMRQSVTAGTAQGLSFPDLRVAAKTGTAQIGAQNAFVNSWVVGFWPYESPRYAFVVLMEHGPQKNLIGGVSVMRKVFEWMRREAPEYASVN